MFDEAYAGEQRNRIGDWVLRGGIALAFFLFGLEKFSSVPGTPWVKLFEQIGMGQWFRYFTGVVEIVGSMLVVIPWTARAGLGLLAATMAAAALILDFVIGHPADSILSTGLFIILAVFWWARRSG
jgi:putative oxidoreductase